MLETLYNTSKIHDSDIVVSKYFLGRDNKEIIKGTRFKSQTLYEDKFIKKNIKSNKFRKNKPKNVKIFK